MNHKTVVIYGAGASHASGYKVKISIDEKEYFEQPLMDENYFSQEPIRRLVETSP
jgi:hypothetical protein